MNVYSVLSISLGFMVVASSAAQTNHFRDAYPLCFEVFQDESSEEHKACIELQARNPSGWTSESIATSVGEELDRRKRAEEAERQLKANREAANSRLSAMRGDPDVLEFKGMALGMDLATIQATGRFDCRASETPLADRMCRLKYGVQETIAEAPVTGLFLAFYSDRLEQISISFDTTHFASVIQALEGKYGPGGARTETLTNAMGARFENQKMVWRKGKASIRAERYWGKLDRSNVTYQTDFSIQEFARRRNSSAKSKSKDL